MGRRCPGHLGSCGISGLARSTIWQRYKEWNIPHIRVGGSLVFLKPELDKWKATHDTPHVSSGLLPPQS